MSIMIIFKFPQKCFVGMQKQDISYKQIIIYVLCLFFLPDEILYMKPIDKAVDK